jgi:hypothetical protein
MTAKLLEDGFIEIRVDSHTVVTRRVKERDKLEHPELFKRKARGRPKKVAVNDSQGST